MASFGMAKLTIAEEAAVLEAIASWQNMPHVASVSMVRMAAESILGAPLDAKKAAIDDLWRAAQKNG